MSAEEELEQARQQAAADLVAAQEAAARLAELINSGSSGGGQ